MLGLNKKNPENENIKNPPSDDSYPIVTTLFKNKRLNNREIDIPCLSLTILNLINENQIKCEISCDGSHDINGKPNEFHNFALLNSFFSVSFFLYVISYFQMGKMEDIVPENWSKHPSIKVLTGRIQRYGIHTIV